MSDLRKTVLMKESMDIDSPTWKSMDIDSPTRKSIDTDTDSTGDSTLTTLSLYSSDSSSRSCSPSPHLPDIYDPNFDYQKLSPEEYRMLLISMLKPPSKVDPDWRLFPEKCAELVLAYYKEKTGEEYEFVRIRSLCPFPPRDGRDSGGTHLNFFARHRGHEYMFYGELVHSSEVLNTVVDCYIFPLGLYHGMEFTVHPPHVDCPDCNDPGLYEAACDSDDEF